VQLGDVVDVLFQSNDAQRQQFTCFKSISCVKGSHCDWYCLFVSAPFLVRSKLNTLYVESSTYLLIYLHECIGV